VEQWLVGVRRDGSDDVSMEVGVMLLDARGVGEGVRGELGAAAAIFDESGEGRLREGGWVQWDRAGEGGWEVLWEGARFVIGMNLAEDLAGEIGSGKGVRGCGSCFGGGKGGDDKLGDEVVVNGEATDRFYMPRGDFA